MVNENVLVNHTIELAFLTGNEVHGVNYWYSNVKQDADEHFITSFLEGTIDTPDLRYKPLPLSQVPAHNTFYKHNRRMLHMLYNIIFDEK
ncbi:Uncharacterized protein FWK35_00012865 [Aphis craccivora]|uniref:Uncharacterized protein n=1 Tax=Aphis craccivora TaxID=307492 RepID=A0A6G0ZAN0_APHCR|nr:Uncharacterized protein FWK35_00012865 [Aphis craccivora]